MIPRFGLCIHCDAERERKADGRLRVHHAWVGRFGRWVRCIGSDRHPLSARPKIRARQLA